MQLSNRLLAAAAMVTKGNIVADIGCDHAYTSIYLCQEGIAPRVNSENYISAVTSVASVRPAVRNVFFSVKGNGSVSAVSCLYVNSNVIYKHNYLLSLGKIVDRDEAPIGPYGLLSPLARMIRRMGVPRKPKVWRRQFSMYR